MSPLMYCEQCGRLLNRATGRCVCADDQAAGHVTTPIEGHFGAPVNAGNQLTATEPTHESVRRVVAPPPEPKWTLESEDEWRARTSAPAEARVSIGAAPTTYGAGPLPAPTADPHEAPWATPTTVSPPPPGGGWPSSGPRPPAWGAPAPRQQSKAAVTALVLSILSWAVCPVILAVAALVAAARAKREIRASYGRIEGQGIATASQVIAGLNFLMIPVLIAIAIPTFLGAQARAQDRAVQSEVSIAMTAEQTFLSGNGRFTANPVELVAVEPTMRFEAGDRPIQEGPVYLHTVESFVGVSAKSASGTCFYLAALAGDPELGYAVDPACGPIHLQDFHTAWP